MKKIKFKFLWIAVLITFMSLSLADIKGSADHPLVSRFPESSIIEYDLKEFDAYVLPLGRQERGELTKSRRLEGKITQITYAAPQNRSILEIIRSYEKALKKAGFEIIFSGAKMELGGKWIDSFVGAVKRPERYGEPPLSTRLDGDYSYIAARLDGEEAEIYVSLAAAFGWFQSYPVIQLDVIEIKEMEDDLVKITAEGILKELEKTGASTLRGIYFETNADTVTENSKPSLDAAAEFIKAHPELNFYVVGHTDNTGSYSYNLNLSLRRAESVVQAFIKNYDIESARFQAVGVGPVSPIAPNTTEEGRAENRRIDIVVR